MNKFGINLMLGAASLIGVAASSGAAYADDAPAPEWGTFSAYVDVQSDYRFRGISQNDRQFAPQASINWSGPDGFYAGVWASKTRWNNGIDAFCDDEEDFCDNHLGGTPSFELDLYGGKHFDIGFADLNIEAYYYSYPDYNKFIGEASNFGDKKASYFEGIGQLQHSFGDLSLTLTGAMSPEWTLGGGTSGYIEGTASYPLLDWLSISANLGHQWVEHAPSDYTHGDIGLTATWHSWSLDVRFNGTDMNRATCGYYMGTNNACNGTVVGTLTYNIADILK